MDDTMQFAELVRNKREALSMSQAALALACDVSDRTIIRIEGGTRPSPETLMALCSVLAIASTTAHDLLSGSHPVRGEVETILPEAYGDESGRSRLLTLRRILREEGGVRLVTAPDVPAMAVSEFPAEVATRMAPSYSGGAPVNERLLGMIRQQKMSVLERLYAAIAGVTDEGVALAGCCFIVVFGILGTLFAVVSIAEVFLSRDALLGVTFLSIFAVMAAFTAWGYRFTKTGGLIDRLAFTALRVVAFCDDRMMVAHDGATISIDAADILSLSWERMGTGHLRIGVQSHSGRKLMLEWLPYDVRTVRAIDRLRAAVTDIEISSVGRFADAHEREPALASAG